MKRWISIIGMVLATALAARAELCAQCKDNMYVANVGQCVECQGHTSSGAFKLCKACSARLSQCEHCRAALAPAKVAPAPAPALALQGVTGQVVKLKGNFMPTIVSDNGTPPPRRKNEAPLAVPVYVFKGKVPVFAKPDPKHPALVKIVQADQDGLFKVALPPGEYTVVAEINGQLYLNSFDGQNNWSTVQVKEGQWTPWPIRDTSEAAF